MLEGLREGLRGSSAAMTSASAAFSSLARGDDQAALARKLSDAADNVEDRCRAKAEGGLSSALAHVNDSLAGLAERAKFEHRKALLLDLDSYKRKTKDLRDKESAGAKIDHYVLRDKEDKLRAAERSFSDCNNELMETMQAVQDGKAEELDALLLVCAEACADFFCGAGKACAPLADGVAHAKAHPRAKQERRASPEDVGDYGGGDGYGGGYGRAAAQPEPFKAAGGPSRGSSQDPRRGSGDSDPFASTANGASDPFASPAPFGGDPFAAQPVAAHLALPAAAHSPGAQQRQATFDYAATEAGELTFAKGDVIDVLAEDASGWWQGRNTRTGQAGAFPSNYTVEIQGSAHQEQPAQRYSAPQTGAADPFGASFI